MSTETPSDIPCLVRIEGRFINESNIRAIKREGSGTRIVLIHGEDVLVKVDYDKVKALFPKVR